MPLVPRAQWGARPPRSGRDTSITAHPSITVHWEGAGWKWPWDHSTCDNKIRNIQDFHMDVRGWSDIAYNYVNCPHGYTYEGRGYDERSSANGNNSSNFASFATQGMWGSNAGVKVPNALKDALLLSMDILRTKGHATAVVKGHRDWHSTDCPGDELYAWVKAGCPDPTPSVTFEDAEMLSPEAQRQVASTMVAVLDQEVKNGQSLHELVQSYSAFNARNVAENKDLGVEGVELTLKDDFASLGTRLAALEAKYSDIAGQLANTNDLLRQLLAR